MSVKSDVCCFSGDFRRPTEESWGAETTHRPVGVDVWGAADWTTCGHQGSLQNDLWPLRLCVLENEVIIKIDYLCFAVLQHFVSERKYDEDLGKAVRFTFDLEPLKTSISTFGSGNERPTLALLSSS